MTEKKKIDENQVWVMLMTVLPFFILMNLGRDLTDDRVIRMLYALLLGGSGAAIGFVMHKITKNKSRYIKAIVAIGIISLCGLLIHLLS